MSHPVITRDADHRYMVDGRVYPSVTTILGAVGIVNYKAIPAAVGEAAMLRGTYVHQATELDDKGVLNEETLDHALVPYLKAWRSFKADKAVEIIPGWVERFVYSEALGYAGQVDRVVKWKGVEATLDIKTGKLQRWTGVQLAAYDLARGVTNQVRLGVELGKGGLYKVTEFNEKDDYAVWLAALKVYKFANQRGA